ncbi:hypothetical protein [Campylobacter hyointestinalis]|uniref:Uncharacterized protein n=1 Tax=Campylobacter hyointestinalis subsp. hyointestinalis TaxID=91352 RepID=A0A9W5AP19_CAMHY|nr:hypothetical protein [Campylobacter hyointestinalis]CUU73906.1 Uncharacterised protein [Campylobacter hyointestinalis subsp. hyointestinalis]CUU81753.1 Uncharacterised protein [Campylobacter hyointestinalis subsp. hyointestinalis]
MRKKILMAILGRTSLVEIESKLVSDILDAVPDEYLEMFYRSLFCDTAGINKTKNGYISIAMIYFYARAIIREYAAKLASKNTPLL